MLAGPPAQGGGPREPSGVLEGHPGVLAGPPGQGGCPREAGPRECWVGILECWLGLLECWMDHLHRVEVRGRQVRGSAG